MDKIEHEYEKRIDANTASIDVTNKELALNSREMFDALQSSITSYQNQMEKIINPKAKRYDINTINSYG